MLKRSGSARLTRQGPYERWWAKAWRRSLSGVRKLGRACAAQHRLDKAMKLLSLAVKALHRGCRSRV